jgi:hypothetical protein
MAVPNHLRVAQRLFETGLFDLRTHEGQGAFVDATVAVLHTVDKRWGHLKKNTGQTHVHGHAEDAALYLSDTPGQSQAVDFIGGAGGPNPKPAWNVDQPRYSASDWRDPFDHGFERRATPPPPPPPPPPQLPPYPSEDHLDDIGNALFADYGQAHQAPNPQMFRFAFRVAYDWLTKNVPDLPAAATKHRREWRQLLGLPPQ